MNWSDIWVWVESSHRVIDAVVRATQGFMIEVGAGVRPRPIDGTKLSYVPMFDEGSKMELSLSDPVSIELTFGEEEQRKWRGQ